MQLFTIQPHWVEHRERFMPNRIRKGLFYGVAPGKPSHALVCFERDGSYELVPLYEVFRDPPPEAPHG